MDESKFPRKSGESRERNIKSTGTYLAGLYPIISIETGIDAVRKCLEAPDSEWMDWDTSPPKSVFDAPILAHDALGYIHSATHMIGARNRLAFERWIRVRIPSPREVTVDDAMVERAALAIRRRVNVLTHRGSETGIDQAFEPDELTIARNAIEAALRQPQTNGTEIASVQNLDVAPPQNSRPVDASARDLSEAERLQAAVERAKNR